MLFAGTGNRGSLLKLYKSKIAGFFTTMLDFCVFTTENPFFRLCELLDTDMPMACNTLVDKVVVSGSLRASRLLCFSGANCLCSSDIAAAAAFGTDGLPLMIFFRLLFERRLANLVFPICFADDDLLVAIIYSLSNK